MKVMAYLSGFCLVGCSSLVQCYNTDGTLWFKESGSKAYVDEANQVIRIDGNDSYFAVAGPDCVIDGKKVLLHNYSRPGAKVLNEVWQYDDAIRKKQ